MTAPSLLGKYMRKYLAKRAVPHMRFWPESQLRADQGINGRKKPNTCAFGLELTFGLRPRMRLRNVVVEFLAFVLEFNLCGVTSGVWILVFDATECKQA